MKALLMVWFKKTRLVLLVGLLLLLMFKIEIPVSVVAAQQKALRSVATGMVQVQTTPTADATVTALNTEKLRHENDWWWNYGATILTSLISTFTLVAAGIFTVVRYFNDRRDTREKQEAEAKRLAEDRKAERERRDEEQQRWLKDQEVEREKRAEERFQSVVEGLSGEREEARIGAAILLRTFLRPGYEQFYTQTFDLAVVNLRLSRTSHLPEKSDTSLPLTTLSRTLITVFKEAFPLTRTQHISSIPRFSRSIPTLDASGIGLDKAYLGKADLKQAWMPLASLQEADLRWVQLIDANLNGANLQRSDLRYANLNGADLSYANLNGADLSYARFNAIELSASESAVTLTHTNLSGANFNGANLSKANLSGATLSDANFSGANLNGANFSDAEFHKDDLSITIKTNLSGANLEDALSLKEVHLRGNYGLTREQLEACKAKGAIIDEDGTITTSQSATASPSSSQSSKVQVSLASSSQGNIPSSDPDKDTIVSSEQEPGS